MASVRGVATGLVIAFAGVASAITYGCAARQENKQAKIGCVPNEGAGSAVAKIMALDPGNPIFYFGKNEGGCAKGFKLNQP